MFNNGNIAEKITQLGTMFTGKMQETNKTDASKPSVKKAKVEAKKEEKKKLDRKNLFGE
jgi:hypothetical protein